MHPIRTGAALALFALGCTPTTTGAEPPPPPPREHPTRPTPPPHRWVDLEIADDENFTLGCAVEHGGQLWCWGQDPAVASRLRPDLDGPSDTGRESSPPSRAVGVDDARAVAVSMSMLCRVDGDGKVRCLIPHEQDWREVEGVDQAVDVMVDDFRGCAVEIDGELRCWEDDKAAHLVHRDVVLADFTLSGGCVLESTGELACWNRAVQRGEPSQTPRHVPPAPGVVALDVVDDQYGESLWIIDDRGRVRLYRFGSVNENGKWETLGQVEGGVEIAIARYHECVRRGDGVALCRGRNSHGQLGDGTSIRREQFTEVDAREVLALSIGGPRTCVRTPTDIACSGWDRPANEQLQQHTLADLEAVSLAASGATTCVVDVDDELRCWGSELFDTFDNAANFGVHSASTPTVVTSGVGELRGMWARDYWITWAGAGGRLRHAKWANEATAKLTVFIPVDPRNPEPPAPVTQLAADHAGCAIEPSAGGTALTCGLAWEPRYPAKGIEGPQAVAVAFRTVCAIDGRGRVACGLHPDLYDHGELVMTAVPGVERARAIAASHRSACARIEDGRVRCWDNESEDTWSGSTQRLRNHAGPVEDVGLGDVLALVGGGDGYCSFDHAGALSCWTPRGDETSANATPKLDAAVVELAAGADHWCARTTDGRITCWGQDESHAQLGRVPPGISLRPVPLVFAATEE